MRPPTPRTLAFVFLTTATVIGGSMYWRTTREELWGYAPFLLYIFLFGAYFLLRNHSGKNGPPDGFQLPIYTGVLLGVGFVGDVGFFPTLFVGFVRLLDRLRAPPLQLGPQLALAYARQRNGKLAGPHSVVRGYRSSWRFSMDFRVQLPCL